MCTRQRRRTVCIQRPGRSRPTLWVNFESLLSLTIPHVLNPAVVCCRADTEIKVPSVWIRELTNVFCLKPETGRNNSHAYFAYCQEFLPHPNLCLRGPSRLFSLSLKSMPILFLNWKFWLRDFRMGSCNKTARSSCPTANKLASVHYIWLQLHPSAFLQLQSASHLLCNYRGFFVKIFSKSLEERW